MNPVLNPVMNRLIAWAVGIALVLTIAVFGIRQYGSARVLQAQQEQAAEAVSEAVAERKEAVKVDVAQTAARAVASRKVASVVISHRETSANLKDIPHYETTPDCAERDAARLGVFLDAAREINRVIDSTPSLP